jgi:hypothetical protein
MNNEKIMTLNHDGKKGVNIDRVKYETMKTAILGVLKEHGDATLSQLINLVENKLAGSFDGKIGWYLMAVKLDLEVRGIVKRIPGRTPQTLTLP